MSVVQDHLRAREPAALAYRERLYQLLPELYRGRDEAEQLARFLALFGHELDRLRRNIDQLRRDFAIDSCQDWVVPYIADLVGTDVLFADALRARADVRDTMRWRRLKGTLVGLEDVAASATGWGVHAAEMFERLIWTQQLDYRRPSARHFVRLDEGSSLARVGTAFDSACYTVDVRPPSAHAGWHHQRRAAFFVWPIPSHQWAGATPARVDRQRYRFHPLGVDSALYDGGDRRPACDVADGNDQADICYPRANHLPIRARDFADHPTVYFGQPAGFAVYEDGILLCRTASTMETRSQRPAGAFGALATSGGIRAADPSLFAGLGAFRVAVAAFDLVTVSGRRVTYSPARDFAGNFMHAGEVGTLDTGAMIYAPGGALPPADDVPAGLLLRIERTGATPDFPESELMLRGARGEALLLYLPAIPGLAANEQRFLWIADDGSSYFARALHDAGEPDLNPDSAIFGAMLPRHLARAALGQSLPRPGVRPVAFRRPVHRDLCCWDQPPRRPLGAGDVAFDPVRGRFAFPVGEEPVGELTVDFRFAIGGEVGAGPFFRGERLEASLTVGKGGIADFDQVQDAIDAAVPVPGHPVIIEVLDGRTYDEALGVDNRSFPDGLTLRAAPGVVPVVRAPAGGPAVPVLEVTATARIARLVLDGLVFAGGAVSVLGDVSRTEIRFCTLHPETVALDVRPANPGAELSLLNAVVGATSAGATVAAVDVADSIVHHPAATPLHPEGNAALTVAGRARLARVTVVGDLVAQTLHASSCILFGAVSLADQPSSCLRFSRVRADVGDAPTFRCTAAFPLFVALRYAHAGYGSLHPNASPAIRAGAEEAGEMGAFSLAAAPQRLEHLRVRLDEYLPAGLRPVVVRVLPRVPFAGVIRR